MFNKKRIWQISDWNITPEQMQTIALKSGWNFCLCQGFHIIVDNREVYLLNDSLNPDPIHYYQEYAAVIVQEKVETLPGSWICKGIQIESLTVNMDQTPLLDLLRSLGDPAKDDGKQLVFFTVQMGDQHSCGDCQ